jgi:hypothetical protein
MAEKAKEGTLKAVNGDSAAAQKKRARRWDQQQSGEEIPAKKKSAGWEQAETPSHG